MSASSANATALPHRRHFLSTIAGAGALSLPVLPAMAWSPGPIEAMWPEYLRLEADLDAAAVRAMDAEERYEEPPRPRWHPFSAAGGYKLEIIGEKKCRCYLDDSAKNIAYLQELISKEFEPDDDPDVCYQHAARGRDARKTLAEIEAWQAEVRRRKDAAGLTEAEAAEQALSKARGAHCEAIFATEATSFRELAFQAAILDIDWDQERAERVLERLTELAGVTPHGLS